MLMSSIPTGKKKEKKIDLSGNPEATNNMLKSMRR